MLNVLTFGDKTGVPVLIVHGLFGSGRNWGVIARRLAETRPVIAVDMRNHGDSPRFPTQSYADMAADLAEVIAAQGGQADVIRIGKGGFFSGNGAHADALFNIETAGLDDAFFQAPGF